MYNLLMLSFPLPLPSSPPLFHSFIIPFSSFTLFHHSLPLPHPFYQVLGVEQVSVDAKEGGNDYCIYLGVEQVYYT